MKGRMSQPKLKLRSAIPRDRNRIPRTPGVTEFPDTGPMYEMHLNHRVLQVQSFHQG